MKHLVTALAAGLIGLAQTLNATPAEDVLRSLAALGLEPTAKDRATITQEISDARQFTGDPEWFDASTARLVDMATLSKQALRPSARIRLVELHRQLLETLVPGENRALALASASDPMAEQLEIGVGMTSRDLGWAVMLEAMRMDLPDDPRQMKLTNQQAEALRDDVLRHFRKSSYGVRHFLSRVDAWAFGTIAAWSQMTPQERQLAVSVVTKKEIPPVTLIKKVIGGKDVLIWLAGMDIGLTDAEQKQFPALATYLREGNMAGGTKDLLAERARLSGMAGTAGAGTVQMMMELNYDLLFGNDLSAGGLMGLD